jgi:hypothetical protein
VPGWVRGMELMGIYREGEFPERGWRRADQTTPADLIPAGPGPQARSGTRESGDDRREGFHGALGDVDVADAELAALLLELVADLGYGTD